MEMARAAVRVYDRGGIRFGSGGLYVVEVKYSPDPPDSPKRHRGTKFLGRKTTGADFDARPIYITTLFSDFWFGVFAENEEAGTYSEAEHQDTQNSGRVHRGISKQSAE